MPTGAMEATAQTGIDFLLSPSEQARGANPAESQKAVKSIWEMLLASKRYRGNWDRHWERYWNLWDGIHWQRPKFSLSQSTVNLTHRMIETFVGNVTDNVPTPNPRATHSDYAQAARIAKKQLEYVWRAGNGVSTIRRPLRSALVSGIGWLRVDWDDSKLRGKGDVSFTPR